MRLWAAVFSGLLLIVGSCFASADFSGTWAIDLKASTSPDALLKRLQIPLIQRRLAASLRIKAVYRQSQDLLTVDARGPGFSRTEQIHFNKPPVSRNEQITGPYTIESRWSGDRSQLITTYEFRTKDGKKAAQITKQNWPVGSSIAAPRAVHAINKVTIGIELFSIAEWRRQFNGLTIFA